MNIKELWVQSQTRQEIESFTEGSFTTQVTDNYEKFAKSIVLECIQIMEARKYEDPDDSAEYYVNQGLSTGVELIKQHFGVKTE